MKALILAVVLTACAPLTPEQREARERRIEEREYARIDARNEMWDKCRGKIVVLGCDERRGTHRCDAVDYRHAMARCQ